MIFRQWLWFVSTDLRYFLNYWRCARVRFRKATEEPRHVDISVPQPSFVGRYYELCAAMDRHDRCLRDDLMLERKIGIKHWHFRLTCSILGILIVDSWLMYSGVQRGLEMLPQHLFYIQLATFLLKQRYVQSMPIEMSQMIRFLTVPLVLT